MELEAKKIYPWSPELKDVKRLYELSFPAYERLPFWQFVGLAMRQCGELWGFIDQDAGDGDSHPTRRVVGFAHILHTDEMIYLFYLATDPTIRSKGYGTAIMDWLRKRAAGQQVVLDMETVQPGFDNYEQRLARQKFYFRNGFHDTGYRVIDELHAYDVLSSDDRFRPEQLARLIKVASFGTDHDLVVPAEALPERYMHP